MATAALKLQQGNAILRKYAEVEQAVIFGSRAKGNYNAEV